MARRWRLLIPLALVVLALIGWGLWTYFHPEPGPLRLAATRFADLPGWDSGQPRAALVAFQRSCAVLANKADTAPMGGAGYAGTVGDWRAPCRAAGTASPGQARTFFETWFTPVAVSAGWVREGRFTGYYEPEIAASRKRQGAFQTPVYDRPEDLVTADLGAFRPSLKGENIAGRVQDGRLVPYATRAEIDAKGLAHAPVLFYTDDPIALFFLHIQGSGRARFAEGDRKSTRLNSSHWHVSRMPSSA